MGLSVGIGGAVDYYERDADNECEPKDLKRPEHDLHAAGGERTSDYYSGDVKSGKELAGRWRGPGADDLGLQGKVTSWQLHKLYGEHTDPITLQVLGSRPRQYKNPEQRLAERLAAEPFATEERKREIELSVSDTTQHNRNFFDLTFSLPKSYSILHAALIAAGRDDEAQQLVDAHHAAIDESLKTYMDEAGFSRKGHHGKQVAGWASGERIGGHAWVYSFFDHRTSRAGDPQLHTHVLVNNKVLNDDGVWRTLDSRAIFKMSRSVGALHERFMAEKTAQTMGLEHRARLDGFGWEVEGITQDDIDMFSSRRRAIEPIAAEMKDRFVERFNREPSAREMDRIMQAATLASRPDKAQGKTFEEYVAEWNDRYAHQRGEHLADILDRVPMHGERDIPSHGAWDRSEVLKMAVTRCEQKYPTWGRPQMRQALSDLLPANLGRSTADELMPYLDSLVDEAIGSERVVTLNQPAAVEVPMSLRHENGRSIYEPFHVERFTTEARLSGEGRLAALAQRTDGPRLTEHDAHRLIIETTLHPDQARVVHAVLTNGRRLNYLEGKAGEGKSFVIGKASDLWDYGIGGKVIGLAKSQNATEVLVDEGLSNAFNFDAFRTAHEAMAEGGHSEKAARTLKERYGVSPQTLLIVDEVSTLNDDERFWLEEFATKNDVTMFWVGDRGQVGAVGADAALSVLADVVPPLRLETARRFSSEWEGPASQALHDRKLTALAQYEAHGRIVSGTREELNKKAIDTLVADILQGRNALLMVPTSELAAEMDSHVRQRLIELGHVDPSAFVKLHNGTYASPGDLVQGRLTTRQLPGAPIGEGISNRDMFHVQRVEADGSLLVRQHLGHNDDGPVLGDVRVLPAAYVSEHVEGGRVTTVHSKIGRTVENGYELITDASTWNGVYTGATRGKDTNVIFVPVNHEDGVPIETGADVLARIAEREDVEPSATEAQQQELDAPKNLARLGPIYDNELAKQTRQAQQELFDRVLPPEYAGALRTDESAAALFRLTHALEREGHDVEQVIRDAVAQRELGSADSIGQVMHWRITREVGPVAPQDVVTSPHRYVDAVPAGDTPELNYLRQVAEVMDERVQALGNRQVEQPEPWAVKHLGQVPTDPVERLEWAEKAAQVAGYREKYGITDRENAIGEAPGRSAADQRAAWEESYSAIGRPAANEDVARLSEGELLLNVDQYKRIEAWMPPDVSENLRITSTAAREYATQAALDRAAGDFESAASAEGQATRMAALAVKFEEVSAARRLAEEFTAEDREKANASQRELDRRCGREDDIDGEHPAEPQPKGDQRDYTIDEALGRARQVRQEMDAEREHQEEIRRQEQEQSAHEHQHGQGYEY